MDIFVSVGTGLNPQQEAFVSAIEDRLRSLGLSPRTIGRNSFSADAPLRAVDTLMDGCSGAVVIAVERYRFPSGVERHGSTKEQPLSCIYLPTAWNQIEAALAYSRGLPLLVVVDEQLRCDGLLEKGNDWYVQSLPLEPSALDSAEFAGVLTNWNKRLASRKRVPSKKHGFDVEKISIVDLLGSLNIAQLWAVGGASAAALGAAFALGAGLFG